MADNTVLNIAAIALTIVLLWLLWNQYYNHYNDKEKYLGTSGHITTSGLGYYNNYYRGGGRRRKQRSYSDGDYNYWRSMNQSPYTSTIGHVLF